MVPVVVRHLQGGKQRWPESVGALGSVLFMVCVGGSAVPEFVILY